jgi:hypothetical protein
MDIIKKFCSDNPVGLKPDTRCKLQLEMYLSSGHATTQWANYEEEQAKARIGQLWKKNPESFAKYIFISARRTRQRSPSRWRSGRPRSISTLIPGQLRQARAAGTGLGL